MNPTRDADGFYCCPSCGVGLMPFENRSAVQPYEVVSAEYTTYDDLGEGLRVPEENRDFLIVCAVNSQRAKVTAIRTWRRRRKLPWKHPQRMTDSYLDDGEHPFRGLTAKRMPWLVMFQP